MNSFSDFAIMAKTCTLKYNTQEGQNENILLKPDIQFLIPIYQRPYSWKEEQVRKFLDDIFTAYWGVDYKIIEEPMFIGTIQLSEKNEIIDGQQRLTTFLLLLKILKIKYPKSTELLNTPLNWLKSEVNLGEQQKQLEEVVNSNNLCLDSLNNYALNTQLISQIFSDKIKENLNDTDKTTKENAKEQNFNIEKFVLYIFTKIYFVVIQTKTTLSKTLQIFNAINTTGLELSGADIFKLRLYEYFRDIKGQTDKEHNIFAEISKLYALIETKNKEITYNITNINEILDLYKYVLIARYELNKELYFYETNRFYEELFDAIFNLNISPNFKNLKDKNIDLSLLDLQKIAESRYKWYDKTHKNKKQNFPTAEDACAWHFIWWSRYNRYHVLPYLFMYSFENTEGGIDKMFLFTRQLSKLFIIYSIRFQKIKREIFYSLMYGIIEAIINKSPDDAISLVNEKIGTIENHQYPEWYSLEHILKGDILYNTKLKNIVCRLSAMLSEDYLSTDNTICPKIFTDKIDIEHIQPYNDQNEEERAKIQKDWGAEMNSLGNLIILESSLNRSNQNISYKKKRDSYLKSKYKNVINTANTYTEWGIATAQERKVCEVKKIIDYLFSCR